MKIKAPNKKYTGVSASVTFVNGVGETDDPHLIQWFQEHGYIVEDESELSTELDAMPDVPENSEHQAEKKSADVRKVPRNKKAEEKEKPKAKPKVAPVQPEAISEPDAMPDPEGE